MSGHNKWANIKRRKESVDAKKAKAFSRHIKTIIVAAQADTNPETNVTLRSAIARARTNNVPLSTIERTLVKSQATERLEEVQYEAYGPEGVAIIIKTITNNSNRTVAELRKILSDGGAKIAAPGSVLWSFQVSNDKAGPDWEPKFPQAISTSSQEILANLLTVLEGHEDVQAIFTNAKSI
jgi:YebC/PmpR family DNA-binding regulatory protein